MTLEHETTVPQSGATNEQSRSAQVVDRAGEEVSNVVETATDGVREVADEVKAQAQAVAGEARQQFDDLVGQARDEFRQQAEQRNEQAANQLRSLSEQLVALAEGRTESAGPLVGYLRDVDGQVRNLATRLEQRGPKVWSRICRASLVAVQVSSSPELSASDSSSAGRPGPGPQRCNRAPRQASLRRRSDRRQPGASPTSRWATVRRGSARGRGSEHGRFRRPSRRWVDRLRDHGTVRPGDAAEATRTLPRRPSR